MFEEFRGPPLVLRDDRTVPLYPQNPDAADRVQELDEVVDDLGNMTLLDESDGKVASNDLFAKKKAIYANSKIALTRELADKSEWRLAEVEARAEQYAEMSLKIFVV